MIFYQTEDVRLILPKAALTVVFDECDGFDQDETGGRVIGTYKEHDGKLVLNISGIIEAGPQAQRSAVSFFQDGEHQEGVFRKIESGHPEIEHLGNWHTHHVNGLPTLSNGDVETYHRTVNHAKHNTTFFYALLVTAKRKTKDRLHRYSVRHYIFRRGDDRVYEIPEQQVEIVDAPLLWPVEQKHNSNEPEPAMGNLGARPERVYDRDIFGEFYQGIRPFSSTKLGLYWRGPLELVDGSKVEIVVLEKLTSGLPSYSVTLRAVPALLTAVADELAQREFPSARAGLIMAERRCNSALYEQRGDVQHKGSN
jgi:hypothetical protein